MAKKKSYIKERGELGGDLIGPLDTPVGKQGGLGGEDVGGLEKPPSVPDPLGLVKA